MEGVNAESSEEVLREIQELIPVLESIWHGKKPGKSEAQQWGDAMIKTIDRAFELLDQRERYPDLKETFAMLKAATERADEALYRYGMNMQLSQYV